MITRNKDLIPKGLLGKPIQEILDLEFFPPVRNITCMDQHITFGQPEAAMTGMGISNGYKFQVLPLMI